MGQACNYSLDHHTGAVTLHSPTAVATATGYLWNSKMLLNMNCQGYANVHFMQPEPATYSVGPALEAKTFLQPEHQYYPGHQGRFFYFAENDNQPPFSVPFAPTKTPLAQFDFIVEHQQIRWHIQQGDWHIQLQLSLAEDEVAELWTLSITNTSDASRTLTFWPCFNIGNQSWMNQSADYSPSHTAIIADKVSPYQKTEDYQRQKTFQELTFLTCDTQPTSWTASLSNFIGLGDWQSPSGIQTKTLDKLPAIYETPVAALHYDMHLKAGETRSCKFIFGAAKTHQDITQLRAKYFTEEGFHSALNTLQQRDSVWQSSLHLTSPNPALNHFVNHWLTRQVYYHGQTQRLTTDPQTRNYLQDGLGMCFIAPQQMKTVILTTLAQQTYDGEIPDGVLLHQDAELKYINQVPHTDHAAWLPICLVAYLDETDDWALLEQRIPYADNTSMDTLWQHVEKAMLTLQHNLDSRGLSLINQGDWCDPMNMVGHQGKGVSSWLTMATSWAFQQWAYVCEHTNQFDAADKWQRLATQLNQNINSHFWHNSWYARGITDDNRTFGITEDSEGKIFLNPQSWAMLCGAANTQQVQVMREAIERHLMTAYGPQMLTPAFTHMHTDIGRVTQKFPGVAENGSVYCHAAAFYIYALAKSKYIDDALNLLQGLMTNSVNCEQTGQLPVFIPNYYRGASELYPEHTGRSSRLFNTGTVAWLLRTINEELIGIKGTRGAISIQPQLPAKWDSMEATRTIRNHSIHLRVARQSEITSQHTRVDGVVIENHKIQLSEHQQHITVDVLLPR